MFYKLTLTNWCKSLCCVYSGTFLWNGLWNISHSQNCWSSFCSFSLPTFIKFSRPLSQLKHLPSAVLNVSAFTWLYPSLRASLQRVRLWLSKTPRLPRCNHNGLYCIITVIMWLILIIHSQVNNFFMAGINLNSSYFELSFISETFFSPFLLWTMTSLISR